MRPLPLAQVKNNSQSITLSFSLMRSLLSLCCCHISVCSVFFLFSCLHLDHQAQTAPAGPGRSVALFSQPDYSFSQTFPPRHRRSVHEHQIQQLRNLNSTTIPCASAMGTSCFSGVRFASWESVRSETSLVSQGHRDSCPLKPPTAPCLASWDR